MTGQSRAYRGVEISRDVPDHIVDAHGKNVALCQPVRPTPIDSWCLKVAIGICSIRSVSRPYQDRATRGNEHLLLAGGSAQVFVGYSVFWGQFSAIRCGNIEQDAPLYDWEDAVHAKLRKSCGYEPGTWARASCAAARGHTL